MAQINNPLPPLEDVPCNKGNDNIIWFDESSVIHEGLTEMFKDKFPSNAIITLDEEESKRLSDYITNKQKPF